MYRGMGDTNVNPNSPNLLVNPDTGALVQCDFAHPGNILNAACWGYGSLWGPTAALTVTPPAAVQPPTQAQLDAVQNSADPQAAANDLIQALTNAAILQTQANNAAANPPPPASVPFCGSGSVPWIPGIDNCVLLFVGLGVGIFVLAELTAPKFITRGRN